MISMDVIKEIGVSETPLSPADIYASVSAEPSAGGIAFFVGAVRDHDHGQAVSELRYSAHPSAGDILRTVVEKAIANYPVRAVSAVHRVGDLKIGDIAVVVAVACAGRADAFAACRTIIDDIKHEVPIWKDQRFTNGAQEWVGAEDC
jgi:molybdopterin synthase catalytic subunit